MALAAGHSDRTVQTAAPARLDRVAQLVGIGRFAQQAMVKGLALGRQRLQHRLGTMNGRAFLIAGDQEGDRALGAVLRIQKALHRGDHRSNRALHVSRTAPPKQAILGLGRKGRFLPGRIGARRDYIGVTGKQETGRSRAAPGIEIVHLAERIAPTVKAQLLQGRLHHAQRPLIARCDRRALDQRLCNRQGIEKVRTRVRGQQ